MRVFIVGIIALLAFVCGMIVSRTILVRRAHDKNREAALEVGGAGTRALSISFACEGVARKILEYMLKLEVRLTHRQTQCLTQNMPFFRSGSKDNVGSADAGTGVSDFGWSNRYKRQQRCILHAGLKEKVSARTLSEARLRLSVIVGLMGVLIGACLSNELMALLGVAGLILGARAPTWALSQEVRARSEQLKIELPELLEVVGLCMSSGLSFDRSFGLYCTYFDTAFSRACGNAHRRWTMGFSTRDEALSDLSAQYDSNMLRRVVQNIARSMKFGTSLTDDLKRAAQDSRAEQKTATQERVAKVPVRMMIPTACLILPAMLLLVLGPVLLELIEGF